MPLSKKMKSAKGNQGAQWGDTGSQGNIKNLPDSGGTDKSAKPSPRVNRHGRDVSIGRGGSRRSKRY